MSRSNPDSVSRGGVLSPIYLHIPDEYLGLNQFLGCSGALAFSIVLID